MGNYSESMILAVAIVSAVFLILIMKLALRSQKKPIVSGKEQLLGSIGTVVVLKDKEQNPRVRIRGELWQVQSDVPLKQGQKVKVMKMDELTLVVTPVSNLEQNEGNKT